MMGASCGAELSYMSLYNRLLLSGSEGALGMSVKGTAISCGFSDPFYFSKAFRKQTGRSPSDYRKGEKHEI